MNFVLIAVGRAKPGPERTLFEHYRSRLQWTLDLREIDERKLRDASLITSHVPKGALTIVLDERGKSLGSEALAKQIGNWQDNGRHDAAILIGGADGHAENTRRSADLLLSLGAMTWPHMLVRGLIAEQLYRAECILANHPYHRA